MSLEETDISALLSPFDGSSRGGIDLREDDDPNNAYRRIRDARNEAREEERQSDINGETSAVSIRLWGDVWDDGQEYLRTVAKDLEIVAYMIEASIRLGGYNGLSQSLTLTRELLESFWGELLPAPDEDGIETTLRPLSRLNGDVITYALMRVPVTEDTAVGQMVLWQYGQAKQLETLNAEERETRTAAGAVTMETFNRAVSESQTEFFRRLAADLESSRKAISELQEALEERVGDTEAPNLSRFQKGVEEAEAILRQIAGDRLVDVGGNTAVDSNAGLAGAGSSNSAGGSQSGSPRGEVCTREEALNLLETVAKWFERHEPQSILPSEIRKAIRRGRMSPQELYQDLIFDSEVRRQLFRDVGIAFSEDE